MPDIYGRQVVVLLTNKSGGGVIAGDVVIIDTTNDTAFTTTTSASVTQVVGIAQETIASNATGRVLIAGYAALVNVNASVTRGHFGATFTVAKQATDAGASRTAGTFCEFLTGGTTPKAMVWSTDLLGTSLTNPMANKGEMIVGDTAGAPSALAAGTAGYFLKAAGAGAFPAWTEGPSAPTTAAVATSQATSSATYTDLATSGPSLTVTVGASGIVLVGWAAQTNSANGLSSIDVSGATTIAATDVYAAYANAANQITAWQLFTGLTPGSTTFKEQYRSTSGSTSFSNRRIIAIPW